MNSLARKELENRNFALKMGILKPEQLYEPSPLLANLPQDGSSAKTAPKGAIRQRRSNRKVTKEEPIDPSESKFTCSKAIL